MNVSILKTFARNFKKVNLSFLLLALILVLMNYQLWGRDFWPKHDSLRSFEYFYSFYNEVFLHGEMPRWFPYGTYGLQVDDTQVFHMTPVYYLWMAVGALAKIRNVLIVFKLCILSELFLLLIGTYLFASELFKRKSVVFFVALGVIGSTVWIEKYIWNFRIFYLLPLALYFLTLFFKKRRPHYFWCSGTVCVALMVGNLPYYAPLYLFTLLIFSLLWAPRKLFSCFREKSRIHLLSFAVFLIGACVYLYFVAHMFDFIESQLIAREAGKMSTLHTFLTYQGRTGFQKLAAFFYPIQTDTFTLYLGFLPLLFTLYAVLFVRSREFAAVGFTTLILFAFSFGDASFIARFSYYLIPAMKFFRYIGHIGAIQRLFLMFCAGFGLEYFLDNKTNLPQDGFWNPVRTLLALAGLLIAVALGLLANGAIVSDLVFQWNNAWVYFLIFSVFNFSVYILLTARSLGDKKSALIILLLFFALDLMSYQNMVMAEMLRLKGVPSIAGEVRAYSFQPSRLRSLPDETVQSAYDVVNSGSDPYSIATYNFMQFDPCVSKHRTSHWSTYFNQLFRARGGVTPAVTSEARAFHGDAVQFSKVMGCETQKIRLMGNVSIAGSAEDAREKVEKVRDLSDRVILYHVPEAIRSKWVPLENNNGLGEVNVSSFSFNRLIADANVDAENGAWLYYLDNYHPGWRAKVNGKETSVAVANLAFKAIPLQKGYSHIELSYFDGLRGVASYLIGFYGILFCLAVFGYYVPQLIVKNEN